jgi:hypothetical protein
MALVTIYKVENGNQSIEFIDENAAILYAQDNNLGAPTSFQRDIPEPQQVNFPMSLPSYASDPLAITGGIYFNTSINKIKFYNGSSWETVTSE